MKTRRVLSLVLVLLLLASSAVFAGNGDGSGDGSGDSIVLESSSVEDGSTDIATDIDIVLTFNKNVVNMAVKEENAKHFSMTDSEGNNVAINVVMGDDQLDSSIKRIITIEARELKEGETYTLLISKGLTAKNGSSKLEDDLTISFTTEGAAEDVTSASEGSHRTVYIVLALALISCGIGVIVTKKNKGADN